MSSQAAAGATTLTAADFGKLVDGAVATGRKVIERLLYLDNLDVFVLQSGPIALLIERAFINEFKGLSTRKMKNVRLSPAGTTIELEKYDIYIEAAGLVTDYINHIRKEGSGGFILNLLDVHSSR